MSDSSGLARIPGCVPGRGDEAVATGSLNLVVKPGHGNGTLVSREREIRVSALRLMSIGAEERRVQFRPMHHLGSIASEHYRNRLVPISRVQSQAVC
ncbi:hypothetical protein CLCR_02640 [Cladophialophora carrionii]|uniref:Uncharacterized protein n=1 Tax=Cladophialophora carrionii TaxID=86049 RepID=A0A1C1CFP2_9EURO|nr:hypothetical protein CLCR_02640 [Cladophialophora carrionii]